VRAAHQLSASYLPHAEADPDCWDFSDLGPELSRDARGVRVWLPLKMHGAAVFRAQLDEKLDLAEVVAEAIRTRPELELVAEPELSLLAFRVRHADPTEGDGLTRQLATHINRRQRVLLTGVELGGRYLLRVCVLSFRTHAPEIAALIEDLDAAMADGAHRLPRPSAR